MVREKGTSSNNKLVHLLENRDDDSNSLVATRVEQLVSPGNMTGGRITNWFDLLSLQNLLVRNQLHLSTQHYFSH